ncbi:MAG: hypothetical protein VSS52_000120, partial [Thiotrichaceae bacterium]|nr:hypothetical protein [Thiotrichaceae bacterium]
MLKYVIASTALLTIFATQSVSALLINGSTELIGTEGAAINFEGVSVGVGYVRHWTTRTCKRTWYGKKKCTTHHHQADEVQIGSLTYKWDFFLVPTVSVGMQRGRSAS